MNPAYTDFCTLLTRLPRDLALGEKLKVLVEGGYHIKLYGPYAVGSRWHCELAPFALLRLQEEAFRWGGKRPSSPCDVESEGDSAEEALEGAIGLLEEAYEKLEESAA